MTRTTRTVAALLAATTIAGMAVPATAQTKYYARERLVGLTQAAAPDADNGMGGWNAGPWTDVSACSASRKTQTRTVSCDSGTCDPSSKPIGSQTIACTVKTTCAMQKDYTLSNDTGFRTIDASKGGYATYQEALSACESGNVRFCYIVNYTGSPYEVQINRGTPFAAWLATTANVTYFGPGTGRTLYSGRCVTQ